MKNPVLLLAFVCLFACNDEQEIQFTVAPALDSYVTQFYDAAAARDVMIPRNLIADFRTHILASAEVGRDGAQNTFYIQQNYFDFGTDEQREAKVFLYLSKLFVNKPSAEVVEILKGYKSENKQAVFDQLFNN